MKRVVASFQRTGMPNKGYGQYQMKQQALQLALKGKKS